MYDFLVSSLTISDIAKGDKTRSKAQLEEIVHKHGGEYFQAQLSDLSAYVVAGDDKSRRNKYLSIEPDPFRRPRTRSKEEGCLYHQT